MNRFLKEPLLHFLAIGALLFGAYSWLNRGAPDTAEDRASTVHITTNEIAWLKVMWTRQWQREPTREELRGLVTELLREELLAREARAMGLDENDTIVRRRLAQKIEFLVQDTARLAEPTEDDLQRFYDANPELFTEGARVSFTHVYFSRERRTDAAADAKAALAQLLTSQPSTLNSQHASLGDRLLIDSEFLNADEQTVTAQFGRDFAQAVFALQPGAWHGPVESGYGLHLVRLSGLEPARQRDFAEVKAQVLERWQDERQRESNEKYFAGLLAKYNVVLDESLKPLVGPLNGDLTGGNGGNGGEALR